MQNLAENNSKNEILRRPFRHEMSDSISNDFIKHGKRNDKNLIKEYFFHIKHYFYNKDEIRI